MKTYKKRWLYALIGLMAGTLAMGFSACYIPSGNSSNSAGKDDGGKGLVYKENDSGYTVVGLGTNQDGDLIIPDTYLGKPVTEIGENAFEAQRGIGYVTLPDSIVTISANAFSKCPNLMKVTFGDSVETVGASAFSNCPHLKELYFSEEDFYATWHK